MTKNYGNILADYDLAAMLWRLNDTCGTGQSLDLAETQEIRRFVERLHRENTKPVKLTNVHRVTLFHDGCTVEVLRRGSGMYGPSAQRRYKASRRLYQAMAHLCHTHGAIVPYAYHHNSTVYRICEYVPQDR